ncbi:MAG: hypothetical protein R3A50_07110 [Saprospiraceae bacterium]
MGFLLKLVVIGLLVLLFVFCSRKKKDAPSLQGWLDEKYPGRFQVLYTESDGLFTKLSFKVKKSIVAEKANPMVQALLSYDLRQPDLNLADVNIDTIYSRAEKDWKDVEAFLSILKNKGLSDWSVGIRDGKLSTVIIAEAGPNQRSEYLHQFEAALSAWPDGVQYDKEILIMSPAGMASYRGQGLPLQFWLGYNRENWKQVIYSLMCPYDHPFKAGDWIGKWKFNIDNPRFSIYHEQCRKAAEEWAAQNLKPAINLINLVEFEQIPEAMELSLFSFPYSWQKADEQETIDEAGRIVVEFDLDEQKVVRIQVFKSE